MTTADTAAGVSGASASPERGSVLRMADIVPAVVDTRTRGLTGSAVESVTQNVWAWKDNPTGAFVNWHANVSCDAFSPQ